MEYFGYFSEIILAIFCFCLVTLLPIAITLFFIWVIWWIGYPSEYDSFLRRKPIKPRNLLNPWNWCDWYLPFKILFYIFASFLTIGLITLLLNFLIYDSKGIIKSAAGMFVSFDTYVSDNKDSEFNKPKLIKSTIATFTLVDFKPPVHVKIDLMDTDGQVYQNLSLGKYCKQSLVVGTTYNLSVSYYKKGNNTSVVFDKLSDEICGG